MRRRVVVVVILILILAVFSVVLARSGQFELPWHSIDSGGGTSSGGEFALRAAVGQAEASSLSGGAFALDGGFLIHPVLPGGEQEAIFLPLLRKPS